MKFLKTDFAPHLVKRFVVENPQHTVLSRAATDFLIQGPKLENELGPFTFTSLRDAEHLEFAINIYKGHNGIAG